MTKEMDCRGLACPAPVLQTKEAIETDHPSIIKITVDNEASKQNVSRFLESQHFVVSAEQNGKEFQITGKIMGDIVSETPSDKNAKQRQKKIMVMIATNYLGHGDDGLGSKLMISFLKTLKEMGDELWRLVFVNNGVKLTIKDAEALPVLQEFEAAGIHILVCGTCLTYFGLLDKKLVGQTTNMLDIVTAMQLADKVINI